MLKSVPVCDSWKVIQLSVDRHYTHVCIHMRVVIPPVTYSISHVATSTNEFFEETDLARF